MMIKRGLLSPHIDPAKRCGRRQRRQRYMGAPFFCRDDMTANGQSLGARQFFFSHRLWCLINADLHTLRRLFNEPTETASLALSCPSWTGIISHFHRLRCHYTQIFFCSSCQMSAGTLLCPPPAQHWHNRSPCQL